MLLHLHLANFGPVTQPVHSESWHIMITVTIMMTVTVTVMTGVSDSESESVSAMIVMSLPADRPEADCSRVQRARLVVKRVMTSTVRIESEEPVKLKVRRERRELRSLRLKFLQ
jgi:hypothetical protein